MKLECSIEKIKNALTVVDRITGKNLTLPVLGSVLWVAKGKTLKLRATNLNIGIEVEVPAKIEKEGVVAIRSDVLSSLFSVLSSDLNILFEVINGNLYVKTKTNTIILKSIPNEDFPTIPKVEGESFSIPASKWIEGIKSVYYSASISEIKPEIGSIYVYPEDDLLVFVATDSFRLAEKKIPVKGIPDISKILIPYKNIGDLLRALEVCADVVRISYTRNQIAFASNGVYFTSRLIDGGFPPYQLIIQKEETTSVVVMKQDLINTLKLSTVFADKFFQVVLSVKTVDTQLSITSKNSDVGSAASVIDAVITGEAIEVVCNLKYFLDVFQAISGDSVSLSFTTPQKPIVIKSVTDTNFLYLLMPTNR